MDDVKRRKSALAQLRRGGSCTSSKVTSDNKRVLGGRDASSRLSASKLLNGPLVCRLQTLWTNNCFCVQLPRIGSHTSQSSLLPPAPASAASSSLALFQKFSIPPHAYYSILIASTASYIHYIHYIHYVTSSHSPCRSFVPQSYAGSCLPRRALYAFAIPPPQPRRTLCSLACRPI